MTFALQALLYLLSVAKRKARESVYPVPQEIDWRVANLRLQSLHLEMDSLTKEQDYLASWRQ